MKPFAPSGVERLDSWNHHEESFYDDDYVYYIATVAIIVIRNISSYFCYDLLLFLSGLASSDCLKITTSFLSLFVQPPLAIPSLLPRHHRHIPISRRCSARLDDKGCHSAFFAVCLYARSPCTLCALLLFIVCPRDLADVPVKHLRSHSSLRSNKRADHE